MTGSWSWSQPDVYKDVVSAKYLSRCSKLSPPIFAGCIESLNTYRDSLHAPARLSSIVTLGFRALGSSPSKRFAYHTTRVTIFELIARRLAQRKTNVPARRAIFCAPPPPPSLYCYNAVACCMQPSISHVLGHIPLCSGHLLVRPARPGHMRVRQIASAGCPYTC